ncbi:hypothetical protein WT12_28975 [Burkholderia territorii]|nr:hypothetical protein WT12_28975 [Burkholderia territorii]
MLIQFAYYCGEGDHNDWLGEFELRSGIAHDYFTIRFYNEPTIPNRNPLHRTGSKELIGVLSQRADVDAEIAHQMAHYKECKDFSARIARRMAASFRDRTEMLLPVSQCLR